MKSLKSKTINFNIIVGSIFGIGTGLGYEIPAEAVAAVCTLGNIILRYMTKGSISEK